ncbi:MAG: 30S processome protein Utp24 [Candidatus Bathyarchaeota archaeon]|nr:30S processome protein Utp24 [Candidatus Bathyarchaeota archaeon]
MTAQHTKEPLRIILDANALFVPLEFRMDIFEQAQALLGRNVEFVLLSPVKHELELLAGGEEPKLRRQASFALRLSERCLFVAVDSRGEAVDDVILRVAKSWHALVFTNDRELRRRLRDISVPVIYLRQKSRLDIDGLIS